jgi:hypothetical protein
MIKYGLRNKKTGEVLRLLEETFDGVCIKNYYSLYDNSDDYGDIWTVSSLEIAEKARMTVVDKENSSYITPAHSTIDYEMNNLEVVKIIITIESI